jgi:hypothetical protein
MRYRALACLLATSCSYAFVRPPPSDHPTDPDDCTESRVPPVVDTVLAGMMALTLLTAIPLCTNNRGLDQDGTPADGCDVGAWVGLSLTGVVGIATVVSAVHGFRATSSCRARRERERRAASG